MKQRWNYRFGGWTSNDLVAPPATPPGRLVQAIGADGRFDGAVARFPGMYRIADANRALKVNSDPTADDDFSPQFARHFEITKQKGSLSKIRGLAVGDSAGALELWYIDEDSGDIAKRAVTVKQGLAAAYAGSTVYAPGWGLVKEGSFSILCLTTGDIGEGIELFAAGAFLSIGGTPAWGVARWDGRRWRSLGNGFNKPVHALTVLNGKLYAGGEFTASGDVAIAHLAVYSEGQWSEFANGTNNTVRDLGGYYDGTSAYLGIAGTFTQVDSNGTPTNSNYAAVVKDDGTWYAAGGATSAYSVLGVCGGSLNSANTICFVGSFSQFDGTAVNSAVYWTSGGGYDKASGMAAAHTCNGCCLESEVLYIATSSHTGCTTYDGTTYTDINAGGTARHGVLPVFYDSTLHMVCSSLVGGFASLICEYNAGTDTFDDVGTMGSTYTTTTSAAVFDSVLYVGCSGEAAAAASPWPSGTTWSVGYRDRYIYLMSSTGVHLVASWDPDTSDWKFELFGPGYAYMASPTIAFGAASTSAGYQLVDGAYSGAWRLTDPDRYRYTAMSELDATGAAYSQVADNGNWYYTLTPGAATSYASRAFESAPFTLGDLPRFEVFSTRSNLDEDAPPGGTLFNVFRGSAYNSDDAFTVGGAAYSDLEDAQASAYNDTSMALTSNEAYDPILHAVGALGPCYDVLHYKGVTYAVSERDGYLTLRWTPLFRVEPESFPYANTYVTRIKTSSAPTVRIVAAGGNIYLVGGDYIYLAKQLGTRLGVTEIYAGHSMLSRDAVAVAGDMVVIATTAGLLSLDGRSAAVQPMTTLDRTFRKRWRPYLNSGRVSLAYDAIGDVIFVHHSYYHQTACLWLRTGKVSFLHAMPYEVIVSSPDLDDGSPVLSYWLTERRWFARVNWDSEDEDYMRKGTATGIGLTPTSAANRDIASVSTVSWGGSNRTVLTFSNSCFIYSGGAVMDVSPCYVILLSGDRKYDIAKVVHNTTTALYLSTTYSGIAAGDYVAISPIPFILIAAPLPAGSQTETLLRKKMECGTCSPGAITSGRSPGQTSASAFTFMLYGAMPNHLLATSVPPTRLPVPYQEGFSDSDPEWYGDVDCSSGLSHSAGDNWADVQEIPDAGILVPWLASFASDYGLEVYDFTIYGSIDRTDQSAAT